MARDGTNMCLRGYPLYLHWRNLRFKEVHLAHIFLISVILGFVTEFLPSINFNLAGSNCISN